MSLSRKCAVVGAYEHPTRFAPDKTMYQIMAESIRGALDDKVEELIGSGRMSGEPVVERVFDRLLDQALSFGGGEPVLGLALEFRLADENREHRPGADHDVIAADGGGALALAAALGVIFQSAGQRSAQPGFMGAAVRRRHGVAVGRQKAVGVRGPRHRPLAGAVGAIAATFSSEDIRVYQGIGVNRGGEIILQAADEMKGVCGRNVVDALQQLGLAAPADFAAGAELHLVPATLGVDPRRLAAFIRDRRLTQWFSVPSVLTYMAKFGVVRDADFPSLERLMWCGEVLPTPILPTPPADDTAPAKAPPAMPAIGACTNGY